MTLRLALVGGPMYDGLYDLLGAEDVDVAVHADHPTLNREVAARLAAGDRIDVLSTHSKYAPSQRQWLRPLDGLVPGVAALVAPGALDLCRFDGELLSVPRNIDVRVLWWRTDRLESPPSTWQELDDGDAVFGFPGRESGLFGTFFEIVVANGGCLFDDDARPTMVSDEAVDAVDLLCRLAARAPADLPDWHYDQVDAALLDGRVDLAAAWPGAYGAIRSSPLSSVLAPAPYLAGRERWVSYSGCHAWAIPRSCADVEGAVALITRLTAHDAAMHDAGGGSIPAHASALDDLEPADGVDAERLAITRRTIAEAMITYPALTRFPEVEDAGWSAINAALRGESSPRDAVEQIQRAAEEALA